MLLSHEMPIAELAAELDLARQSGEADRVRELEQRLVALRAETYSSLTLAQRLAICRHPQRPRSRAILQAIATDMQELAGDRQFGEDCALIGALVTIGGRRVLVLAQERGHTTEQRIQSRFGMMNPEGYRKAVRLMDMAAKFDLPIITLIDTPGAYAGLEAEERGQGWAIARSLATMIQHPTPIVSLILGDGCSGGALGLAIADRLAILENGYYSVISPEGCASILWRDPKKAVVAGEALQLQAQDLLAAGLVDTILPEPEGGSHRDPQVVMKVIQAHLESVLSELESCSKEELLEARYQRHRYIGWQRD
ncbi:MAG: acetyl-CoA carboxylase carboxyltransferase subunit alpha [Chlamydiia bacterium]